MKPINSAMINMLLSESQFAIGEFYDFAFVGGSHAYYTDLDIPIALDGNTYVANSLRIEGMKFKIAVGWQVDEQQIKISAIPADTLGGAAFFEAVSDGLLDGATIKRSRGFWDPRNAADPNNILSVYRAEPLCVVPLFTGLVSQVDKIGRTHVEMKLKSPLKLLDIDMPRNTYEPGCQWALYDAGCTVNRATYTTNFTVVSATDDTITVASIDTPVGADGQPYYAQGRLVFTSGANNGLQVLVGNNDSTTFFLQYALTEVPAPGDTFAISAGCLKTGRGGACELKFANLINFRGFPRVPPIFVSV